jgi:hypothetical protein
LAIGVVPEAIVEYTNNGLTPATRMRVGVFQYYYCDPALHITYCSHKPIDFSKTFPYCNTYATGGEILPSKTSRTQSTDFAKESGYAGSFINQMVDTKRHMALDPTVYDAMVKDQTVHWEIVADFDYFDQFGHCHASVETFEYVPQARDIEPLREGFYQRDW